MKKRYSLLILGSLFVTGCADDVLNEMCDASKASDVQTRTEPSSFISSEKDVNFGLSVKYDNGIDPAVSINAKKMVLEVHRSSTLSPKLWYRVGKTNQMDVNWGGSVNYDTGCDPSIALNDNNVAVEIHRSPTQAVSGEWVKSGWFWYYKLKTYYKTWYHVGVLSSGGKMSWGGSVNYGDGEEPDIAANNNNICVEVHRSGSALFYRVGIVNPANKTISFGNNGQYAGGYSPEVAFNNRNEVISVYHDGNSNLYYRVGIVNASNKTIAWGTAKSYEKGNRSDIALTDNGDVLETHVSAGRLHKIVGHLNASSKVVQWSASEMFDVGSFVPEEGTLGVPCVAIASDASMAIQTHSCWWKTLSLSPISQYLMYSTSLYIDRLKWMETERANLKGKSLYSICMPGSHDAGTYNISGASTPVIWDNGKMTETAFLSASLMAPFAKAQDLSILGQLKKGVRFFDLRPYVSNRGDSIYTHHGLMGASFKEMLADLQTFMNSTNGEVVIVRIGWFSNFGIREEEKQKNHDLLAEMIHRYLGNHLYKEPGTKGSVYSNLTYDEVVNGNGQSSSKAIVLYADNSGQKNSFYEENGFFTFAGLSDNYANSTIYNEMVSNQLSYLKSNMSTDNRNFLLSWTLTVNLKNPQEAVSSAVKAALTKNLGGLSNLCNRSLRNFTATYGKRYPIGILFTDYVERASSTDCAIMLNRNE